MNGGSMQRLRRSYRDLVNRPRSHHALHRYWRSPSAENVPQLYLRTGYEGSRALLAAFETHAQPRDKILEIGCNAGRNLNTLFEAGFTRLAGLDINSQAITLLQNSYPRMARSTQLHVGAVETQIRLFADCAFDVVYTVAVLEHIHRDSEWVFAEMARIAGRLIITLEDEVQKSWRHIPRNYRTVFERLNFEQVEERTAGLHPSFVLRIFQKVSRSAAT
jgi:SAM-dependent methyltransferase